MVLGTDYFMCRAQLLRTLYVGLALMFALDIDFFYVGFDCSMFALDIENFVCKARTDVCTRY